MLIKKARYTKNKSNEMGSLWVDFESSMDVVSFTELDLVCLPKSTPKLLSYLKLQNLPEPEEAALTLFPLAAFQLRNWHRNSIPAHYQSSDSSVLPEAPLTSQAIASQFALSFQSEQNFTNEIVSTKTVCQTRISLMMLFQTSANIPQNKNVLTSSTSSISSKCQTVALTKTFDTVQPQLPISESEEIFRKFLQNLFPSKYGEIYDFYRNKGIIKLLDWQKNCLETTSVLGMLFNCNFNLNYVILYSHLKTLFQFHNSIITKFNFLYIIVY